MVESEGVRDLWIWLIQDVSFLGNVQSPLLSWLGAAGILFMCLWHSVVLLRGVRHIRTAVERITPRLHRLIDARQQVSAEWIVIPALTKKQSHGSDPAQARRDLDDLEELDQIMRTEPLFTHQWLSFRKTFAIEQPSWFLEPSVRAEKSAAGFFSFETMCAGHLNMRFYQQLPSILTGIGLLFTFLAILIGLSKLHAHGAEIEGLQGLINGLAGKFVTSIVGLACGNAVLVLEKSLWHRVAGRYRQVVALLDEVFPQHVEDRGARDRASSVESVGGMRVAAVDPSMPQLMQILHQRLQGVVESLNVISDSLASRVKRDSVADQEALAVHLGRELRQVLGPVFNPIRVAMEDLNRTLHAQQPNKPLSADDMEQLVGLLSERIATDRTVTAGSADARTRWRLPGLSSSRKNARREE